eukprot:m51a1_g13009 hypothetical protein (75) ;mRNA; f:2071-2295
MSTAFFIPDGSCSRSLMVDQSEDGLLWLVYLNMASNECEHMRRLCKDRGSFRGCHITVSAKSCQMATDEVTRKW